MPERGCWCLWGAEALADAMLRLIQGDELHAALRARGLATAEMYSADNAVRLWSSLLGAASTSVVFVAPLLRNGGAERVLASIANALAAQGRDVEIISFAYDEDISQLDRNIRVRFLHNAEEFCASRRDNDQKKSCAVSAFCAG